MTLSAVVKFSVSLPQDSLRYLETYQREHGLASRSEALERALRELELITAYRQAAEDQQKNPDPFLDLEIGEGLEPSDGKKWL